MLMADRLTLDAPRRTTDGYLAVRAKAARTGAYEYTGVEVDPDNSHGLRDQTVVNVLREADQVFDARSLGSFVGKPITDDHPASGVNANNWRDHARGVIMGAVKDGDHVGFDLAFLDAATIAKVDAGKVELSNGYSCKLEFGDFTAADGTKCQARQTNITGNHIALVDRGRAGSTCRVADAARCDAIPTTNFTRFNDGESIVPKNMTIDGLTVDIANADTAEATIKTLLSARDTAQASVATLTTEKATLDAENATLKTQLADAKNPQALRDAAQRYATVTGKAKALGVAVTDAMDEPSITRAVVDAKLGDTAKGWTDAQYAASFAALTADVKVDANDRKVVPIGSPATVTNDNAGVRDLARTSQYN